MFASLFVPYTNSHFWTDQNQTLHTSLPWSGRDRRICMVRKCLTFSTFLTFVGSWCRILGTKWLQARVIRDNVISVILAGVSATSRKWRCSRRQFCVSDQIFALLKQVSVEPFYLDIFCRETRDSHYKCCHGITKTWFSFVFQSYIHRSQLYTIYVGRYVKCLKFLFDFNQTWCLSTVWNRKPTHHISRKSLQWEPSWY